MQSTIAISLPDPVRRELDRMSQFEGVSRSDIVHESLRDLLFVRRFRSLRRSMVAKASRRGVSTDQDVFNKVS